MDVDLVLNLYIFFLAAAAVLCMVIAWFVTKVSENILVGFLTIFIVSILCLLLIIGWFQSMTAGAASENIHWIFSYGLVLLLYPVYLFFNWFVLKRARGVQVED